MINGDSIRPIYTPYLQRSREKEKVEHIKSRFIVLYPQFTLLSLASTPGDKNIETIHDCPPNIWRPDSDAGLWNQDSASCSDNEDACMETMVVKIHVLYLACLQTLVKMNPKAFHSEWPRLLGKMDTISNESIEKGGFAPLAYFVVHNPSPRLRHAAASSISTLIEGPAQRAYLGLGEDEKSIKSYISLSQSLGQTIVGNIQALSGCILSETDDLVCCSIIRALTTFLVGCSWNKITHRYFWMSVQVLHRKIGMCRSSDDARNELLFTCLHSLATLFSLKIDSLADDSWSEYLVDDGTDMFLSDTLATWASSGRLKVKLEATLAIRGMMRLKLLSSSRAIRLYPLVAHIHKELIVKNNKSKQYGAIAERLQQQLVLFVGDMAPYIHLHVDASPSITMKDVCMSIIIPAAHHTSPRVRAASFVALTNVPSEFWNHADMPEDISSILLEASTTDSESTVRSSAMKAYGARVQYMDIIQVVRDVHAPLQAGLFDSVLAVRIPSAVILEAVSNRLWQSSMEHLTDWKDSRSGLASSVSLLAEYIPKACTDHDKVKVHGIHALGYLIGTRYRTTSIKSLHHEDDDTLQSTLLGILEASVAEGSLAIKWSSYEACRIILLTARLTASTQEGTDSYDTSWKYDPFLQSIVNMLQCQVDQSSQNHVEDGGSRSRVLLDQALVEFSS